MFQSGNHYANHYEGEVDHGRYGYDDDDLPVIDLDEEEVHVFETGFEADAVPLDVSAYAEDITSGMAYSARRGGAVFPYDPRAVSPRVAAIITEALPDMVESAMAKVSLALRVPDEDGKIHAVANRDNGYHSHLVGTNMVTRRPRLDAAYLSGCVGQIISLPARDDLGMERRYDDGLVAHVGQMLVDQIDRDFMPLLKSCAVKAAEQYMHPVGYGAPDVYVDDDLALGPGDARYDEVYREYASHAER